MKIVPSKPRHGRWRLHLLAGDAKARIEQFDSGGQRTERRSLDHQVRPGIVHRQEDGRWLLAMKKEYQRRSILTIEVNVGDLHEFLAGQGGHRESGGATVVLREVPWLLLPELER